MEESGDQEGRKEGRSAAWPQVVGSSPSRSLKPAPTLFIRQLARRCTLQKVWEEALPPLRLNERMSRAFESPITRGEGLSPADAADAMVRPSQGRPVPVAARALANPDPSYYRLRLIHSALASKAPSLAALIVSTLTFPRVAKPWLVPSHTRR